MAVAVKTRRNLLAWVLGACSVLTGCGAGVGDTAPKPVHVIYYGDSLVHQSGDRLLSYLPAGSTLENKGVDAQMAYHAINGSYGQYGRLDLSPIDTTGVFVFAWGTNEALQGVSLAQYEADMNHILFMAQGKRVVLEAPPLILNTQNDANLTIAAIRAVMSKLGAVYGVPVVSSVRSTDFISDGIHPTGAHYDARAKALAEVIGAL